MPVPLATTWISPRGPASLIPLPLPAHHASCKHDSAPRGCPALTSGKLECGREDRSVNRLLEEGAMALECAEVDLEEAWSQHVSLKGTAQRQSSSALSHIISGPESQPTTHMCP